MILTYHSDESSDPLTDHSAQQMHLEHRVVFALWSMRVFKDIERVSPVTRSATDILDRVRDIRPHLVHNRVHIVFEEELTDMRQSSANECAVR